MISIVVPVYNLEKYIAACLDSLLAQTYRDIEIIVVDDGSSDASAEIIRGYADSDSRIHPIFKENGGVTDARMRGLSECRGEWIGFVDGDDEVELDMFERLLNNAAKYNADISHCGYCICFSDGRVNYIGGNGGIRLQDTECGVIDILEGTIIEPSLCTKIYKRELFDCIEDLIPKTIKNNEDLLMNYYLFSRSRQSVFEDWCPYHYRSNVTSASHSHMNKNRIYDPILVKEQILKDVPANLLPVARKAYLVTCIHTYGSLINEKQKDIEMHLKRIREMVIQHYDWTVLLPKKGRILAGMIRNHPRIMQILYPIYTKYIQKNKYV